jgi:ankyrin repeat protein
MSKKVIHPRSSKNQLMQAVIDQSIPMIRAAADLPGVDINAQSTLMNSFRGWPPLHYAVYAGYHEVVTCLLELRANIHVRDNRQNTVWHRAAESSQDLSKVLEFLPGKDSPITYRDSDGIERHVKPSQWTNESGLTPLYVAASEGNLPVVQALIAAGADVNSAYEQRGLTPLYVAASEGNLPVVQALIAAGADVNSAYEQRGLTLLMVAIDNGHVEVALVLINCAEINLECFDKRGYTALHHAAKQKQAAVVEALLAKGAEVDSRTQKDDVLGVTPLMCAVEPMDTRSRISMIYYQKGSVAVCPAYQKWLDRRFEIVKKLIDAGASVKHVSDSRRMTPLTCALGARDYSYIAEERAQREKIVRLLLTKGAGETINCGAPLVSVVKEGDKEMAIVLLEYGADPNLNGVFGLSPWSRVSASRYQDLDMRMIQLLASWRADVNAESGGLSFFEYQVVRRCFDERNWHRNYRYQVAHVLLSYGATWDAKCSPQRIHDVYHEYSIAEIKRAAGYIKKQWKAYRANFLKSVKQGDMEDAFSRSLYANHMPAVQWLLDNKADSLTDEEIRSGAAWANRNGERDLESKLMLLQMERSPQVRFGQEEAACGAWLEMIEFDDVREKPTAGGGGGAAASASPRTSTLVRGDEVGGGGGSKEDPPITPDGLAL